MLAGSPAASSVEEGTALRVSASARRPGFVVTLATCMGIGPLLVYGLSALSPLVVSDLGLSRTQFGTFAASAFAVAALTSAVVGRFVDRRSARTTLTMLFVGAGLALVVAAVARSYAMIVLAVAISGAAQALSNPVTNRLVSTYASPGARGLLMGIKQAGVQMAQLTAALALPTLAVLLGWRGALAAASSIAAVALLVSWRSVPGTDVATARTKPASTSDPLPTAVWWMAAHALLTGAALQAVNVYLPLYGYQELELPVPTAALTAALVGGVGVVARICWGRAADSGRSARIPLVVLGLVAALGTASVLAADVLSHVTLLWVGAALFGASGIAANVVLMVGVVRAVPLVVVGRATGALAIGLYLGFALGPVAFGALVDATDSYDIGWAAVTAVYVLSSCLVLLTRLGGDGAKPSSAA
jgi:predicted MFS family arabinose efflux permease